MPRTWEQVSSQLRLNASAFNPKANAIAAAYYMGRLGAQWALPRPTLERLKLAQASYNAGLGTILKAQKACGDALLWEGMVQCVPARETREYVPRIKVHFDDIKEGK